MSLQSGDVEVSLQSSDVDVSLQSSVEVSSRSDVKVCFMERCVGEFME